MFAMVGSFNEALAFQRKAYHPPNIPLHHPIVGNSLPENCHDAEASSRQRI